MKTLEELGISPTPWKVEYTLSSFPICTVNVACVGDKVARNVLEDDARLFAAAPDMYEALLGCVRILEDVARNEGWDLDEIEVAKKALAKAAGEEVEK